MVSKHAYMLRRFLTGRLKLDSCKDRERIHALWLAAFDLNCLKSVKYLPRPHEYSRLSNVDLGRVKSRSMYERLCQRFPKATEANAGFAETDKVTEEHKGTNDATIPSLSDVLLHGPWRLLHVPMRHMWFDILGDTLDKFPYARANDCIVEGHTDLLRHLVETGKVDLIRIKLVRRKSFSDARCFYPMDVAAGRGHLDIVKMLHETGSQEASTMAMDVAACNGHLDVVNWLHENRIEGCTTAAMEEAASNSHLDVIKWLHENRTEGCTTVAMDRAASNGHLDVVKWIHENRTEGCTIKAMDLAASNGHIDVVNWLHNNRNEGCSTKAMDEAATGGHLNVVKFLHKNRTEGCTTKAMDGAAENGHLKVVEWLHDNRTEGCTTKTIERAMNSNRLNVVRFLLENRTEGFTDKAIKDCKLNPIAKMLVSKMSDERRRYILENYMRWGWYGQGIYALERSMRGSR